MSFKVLIFCLLLSGALHTSCKKRAPLQAVDISKTEKLSTEKGTEIKATDIVYKQNKDFKYLQGKAKVTYETNEQNLNLTVNFRLIENEAIWLSASPGLGIEAVRLLITPTKIQIINKIERVALIRDIEQAQALLKLPLDFYSIQSILLANVPNAEQWLSIGEGVQDLSLYNGIKKGNNGKINYGLLIDDKAGNISSLTLSNEEESQRSKIKYDEFKAVNTLFFPYLLDILTTFKSNPNQFDTVHIIWKLQKIEQINEAPELPFDIPKGYDRQ